MSLNIGILESARRTAAPPSGSLLLDTYPGAVAAYSLRKLNSAYIGSAIRVRRDSDLSQIDIGFVNNILDITALTTFVGSSTGRIMKWYDQSGNSNDLLSTSGPPSIINLGTLYTANSLPTIYFNTTYLDFTTSISSFNNLSIFLTQKALSTTQMGGLIAHKIGGSGPAFGLGYPNNNQYTAFFGINGQMKIAYQFGLNVGTNLNVMNMVVNSTNFYPYVNNTAWTISASNWTPGTTSFSQVGVYSGGSPNAYISEIVMYKTDQLSNRSGIVNNTNTFYTLF